MTTIASAPIPAASRAPDPRPFHGTWATVLLPIDENDQIAREKLNGQLKHLVSSGIQGIYTNGTAGEFEMQTEGEFDWLTECVAAACKPARMRFQIGVSHTSPTVLISRLRRACRLDPTGFQFILPAWSALNDDEVLDFCKAVADEALGKPLVLYSPPHAKRVLDPVMFGRIAHAVPSIKAVKLVDGDESWYAQMQEHAPSLALFVPGHQLATGYSRGAAGSFSNVAALSPRGAARWFEQMKTDLPAALDLEKRIRAFQAAHVHPRMKGPSTLSNQAADKLMASVGNWADVGTRVRWPYHSFDQSYAEQLRPIARQMMPELFA